MAKELAVGWAIALSVVFATESWGQGILSDDARSAEIIAEEVLTDLWIEIETEPRYATCFLGELIIDGWSIPTANGVFAFAGFNSRQPSKTGGSAVRTWSTRDVTIVDKDRGTIEFIPNFDTSDRMSRDGEIIYINRGGGLMKGAFDDQKLLVNYEKICLDSRLAMVEFANGILDGTALKVRNKRFIVDGVVSASRSKGKIIAVVEGPNPDFTFHMTLDPKYGYRPSKVAVTKGSLVLDPGDANAIVINELRWEKIGKRWIAVAGRNLQFGEARTKSNHASSVYVSWRAAWWFGDDVDDALVDPKEMSPEPSVLFTKFNKQLEAASQVTPYSGTEPN